MISVTMGALAAVPMAAMTLNASSVAKLCVKPIATVHKPHTPVTKISTILRLYSPATNAHSGPLIAPTARVAAERIPKLPKLNPRL